MAVAASRCPRPPCLARQVWRVGTLTYTGAGIAVLFFWLLWGDFAFALKERSVPQTLQLLLKQFKASDFVGRATDRLSTPGNLDLSVTRHQLPQRSPSRQMGAPHTLSRNPDSYRAPVHGRTRLQPHIGRAISSGFLGGRFENGCVIGCLASSGRSLNSARLHAFQCCRASSMMSCRGKCLGDSLPCSGCSVSWPGWRSTGTSWGKSRITTRPFLWELGRSTSSVSARCAFA